MSHIDAVRTADADETLTRDGASTRTAPLTPTVADPGTVETVEAVDHDVPTAPAPTLKVLLFSDDRTTRQQVRLALGRRIAADLPEIEIFDTATQPAVIKALETGHYDVMILDGEAQPSGGFGIAYQVKDEIPNCPPVVLLVARRDDAWLATWSRAEGISSYPIDPIRLPRTVADVVRGTRAAADGSAQVGDPTGGRPTMHGTSPQDATAQNAPA